MRCGVIIAAAGQGTRLGLELPKAFVSLGKKPIFLHSLDTFLAHPKISEIVLVVPKNHLEDLPKGKYKIVAGGNTRQASVSEGMKALSAQCDWVLVHDAARPFVTKAIVNRLLEKAEKSINSIAAFPIADTVKLAEEDTITKTIERRNLWVAQTPQAFSVPVLKKALAKAIKDNFVGTDEASMVERLGVPIHIILGDSLNMKVTTGNDLKLAEAILERRLCE